MNAFQKRMAETKTKLQQYNARRREEQLFKDLIRRNHLGKLFEETFFALNGARIKVSYKNGYFQYNSMNLREHELQIYLQMMQAKVHEQELQGMDNEVD